MKISQYYLGFLTVMDACNVIQNMFDLEFFTQCYDTQPNVYTQRWKRWHNGKILSFID